MKPLLSILIPTVVGREKEFDLLMKCLEKQYSGDEVEIAYIKDDKTMTIGEKREKLYAMANGLFSWQVDDDDDVHPQAIPLILEAIKSNPEITCITFREKCLMRGEYKSSNHSIKYDKWRDNFDGYDYVRTPFYKDVIRTDIAQSVPFPHIRYNEDEQWAGAIKPLLTDEIHLDEEIYIYIYDPKDTHNERYGFNK
jgi:hypothetical protein